MRKPKQKPLVGRQGGHKQHKSPGGNVHVLDRNLIPRVEEYSKTNSLTDSAAVAGALRQAHKEYARRPQAAFQAMVVNAIRAVQARKQQALASNSNTPTPSDGAAENGGGEGLGSCRAKHGRPDSQAGSSSGTEGSSTSAGSELGSSTDDSDAAGDSDTMGKERGGMNTMLLSMYARTPQAEAQGPTLEPQKAQAPTPAFASPEVIAAAAARALAAQKAKKQGPQTLPTPPPAGADPAVATAAAEGATRAAVEPAGGMERAGMGVAVAAGPSTAQPPSVQAAAGLDGAPASHATPAPRQAGGKAHARTATEAGLQTDGRAAGTAKRARRGGQAGAAGGGGTAGAGAGAGARPRAGSSAVVSARPVTYADLGGVEDVLADIRELIEYPLKHPEVYGWLGVEPPRGVLLHGPPGCGKTALANAIANECGVSFLRVSAPEIVSGMSGESEAKLRGLFQEATDLAPCIVFIDEIDAIAPKRETAQREMERRIVAQMLTCMDDLSAPTTSSDPAGQPHDRQANNPPPGRVVRPHVVVIGATNRPDALDPALRRAGRFDREIALGIPTEAARAKILAVITRGLRLEGNFDFKHIAKRTPGFVGADLMALVKEAAALAVTRIFDTLQQQQQQQQGHTLQQPPDVAMLPPANPGLEVPASNADKVPSEQQHQSVADTSMADQHMGGGGPAAAGAVPPSSSGRFGGDPLGPAELQGLAISQSDFQVAISKVQPSVRREGFTTTPDVTWEDVGSLDEVREELSFSITQPIMHPDRFEALGMSTATGVLLYGPPGCGKTLVAKAVAHESGANFISIKGPELLNKYVGESERAVRQLFARARAAHPCVLFFDELDALAPRRGTDTNQAAERVVNQLLTEMDGVDGRHGVYVVAATNRPDMIDPALLRPGRLDKVLYVPLPPPDGRAAILRALTRRTPLAGDVDVAALGLSQRCTGFSGADMAALVREASVLSLKEAMKREAAAAVAAVGAGAPEAAAANSHAAAGACAVVQDAAGAGDGSSAGGVCVAMRHFEAALARMSPSVSKRDARMYDALRKSLQGNLRSRLEAGEDMLAADAAKDAAGPPRQAPEGAADAPQPKAPSSSDASGKALAAA